MSRGKHSSGAKHFDATTDKKSNSKFLKIIFKILILFIVLILLYFIYDIYLKNLSIFSLRQNSNISSNIDATISEDIEIYEPTEKVEIETFLTVKGAEYLEITGVHINTDNPEISTVTAKLKNNSNESYENVNLRISLFDKDDNEITFLDYKIDKIEANGEAATFAALKKDLSNCENYSIALRKPD